MIAVRIKRITKRQLEQPMPVYDVIEAKPHNNFLIKAGAYSIISHNCSPNDVIGLDVLCLGGEEKVVLANGSIIRLKDLEDHLIQVHDYNIDYKKVGFSKPCAVKKTAEVTELLEITLEDGTILKCTNNHKFLLKNGQYKMAEELTNDDELEEITE